MLRIVTDTKIFSSVSISWKVVIGKVLQSFLVSPSERLLEAIHFFTRELINFSRVEKVNTASIT